MIRSSKMVSLRSLSAHQRPAQAVLASAATVGFNSLVFAGGAEAGSALRGRSGVDIAVVAVFATADAVFDGWLRSEMGVAGLRRLRA